MNVCMCSRASSGIVHDGRRRVAQLAPLDRAGASGGGIAMYITQWLFWDSSLDYRDTDNDGREFYCPVCLKYRGGEGHEVIKVYAYLCASRKAIGRNLVTQRHKQALEEEEWEAVREVWRRRVGMSIARTTLMLWCR